MGAEVVFAGLMRQIQRALQDGHHAVVGDVEPASSPASTRW
jgi:hypothetical protein